MKFDSEIGCFPLGFASPIQGNTGVIVRMKDITDGLSKTLGVGNNTEHGNYWNSWYGNNLFCSGNPPNTTAPDHVAGCDGSSADPRIPCKTFTTYNAMEVYVRSAHNGGANVGLMDGECDSSQTMSTQRSSAGWEVAWTARTSARTIELSFRQLISLGARGTLLP